MAKNDPTGDNSRKDALKHRSQVLNPITGLYTKRDKDSGQFMSVKITGGKYRGVRNERNNTNQ